MCMMGPDSSQLVQGVGRALCIAMLHLQSPQ